jgi:hypothetical protein
MEGGFRTIHSFVFWSKIDRVIQWSPGILDIRGLVLAQYFRKKRPKLDIILFLNVYRCRLLHIRPIKIIIVSLACIFASKLLFAGTGLRLIIVVVGRCHYGCFLAM